MIQSSYFHPMTIHFPIALIMIGFIVDLVSMFNRKNPCLSRTGYYMEIFGMIAAIVAFGTGYYFTSQLSGKRVWHGPNISFLLPSPSFSLSWLPSSVC